MKVLDLNKRTQIIIGMFREETSDWKATVYMYFVNVLFFLLMFLGLAVGSFLYMWENLSDLKTSTNALLVTNGALSSVGVYFGLAVKIKSTQKLYKIVQSLADESLKYRDFTEFPEAEEKSQRLCKWLTMFMMLFFTFGTILVSLGMSLWSILSGNTDSETWYLPYKLKLPIDKSTYSGWYCELFLQATSGYGFVISITATVTFFAGCSFYIEACLRQFKYMFMKIDEDVRNEESHQAIEKKVFDTITFHKKVIELFDTVADAYSIAIFFHLIFNILFFASAIFQTEMFLGEFGLGLLFSILCVMEGLSYTFVLCYYANLASLSMADLANTIYYSDWYYQPAKVQKLLLLMITRGQRRNIFTGLKIIYCSLEAFTQLNKTAATYYIMFHNISR